MESIATAQYYHECECGFVSGAIDDRVTLLTVIGGAAVYMTIAMTMADGSILHLYGIISCVKFCMVYDLQFCLSVCSFSSLSLTCALVLLVVRPCVGIMQMSHHSIIMAMAMVLVVMTSSSYMHVYAAAAGDDDALNAAISSPADNANNERDNGNRDGEVSAPIPADGSGNGGNTMSLPDDMQWIASRPTWRTSQSFTDKRRGVIEGWPARLRQLGGPTAMGRQDLVDALAQEVFEMLEYAWTGNPPTPCLYSHDERNALSCM